MSKNLDKKKEILIDEGTKALKSLNVVLEKAVELLCSEMDTNIARNKEEIARTNKRRREIDLPKKEVS